LISPLVKKIERKSWRQPKQMKNRISKGLSSSVLVIVAAICIQRYSRGYLVRKKITPRKMSFHATGVANRASSYASSIVSVLSSNIQDMVSAVRSISEASQIASCASKYAVEQALLARSSCDDVIQRREQKDRAALLSAVAAFAACVASRDASKTCEDISFELEKKMKLKKKEKLDKERNVVKEKNQKKKMKKKKRKKNNKKKKEEKIDTSNVNKNLPFIPTAVQYWSPIQKVSTQNQIPDSMIVRARFMNNRKEEKINVMGSLFPPRHSMKIECDEISNQLLTPVVNKTKCNDNLKEEKKRKASKLINTFEKIQNVKTIDNSESDLTRGEETKRLVLETHEVDVTMPSLATSPLRDLKTGSVSSNKEKHVEEISSETPQETLRRLRLRNENTSSSSKNNETSCACACVVM